MQLDRTIRQSGKDSITDYARKTHFTILECCAIRYILCLKTKVNIDAFPHMSRLPRSRDQKIEVGMTLSQT